MSTVEVAPHGPRPPIRLRPAPRSDPPYDDEVEPGPLVIANQLALEWPRPAPQWGSVTPAGMPGGGMGGCPTHGGSGARAGSRMSGETAGVPAAAGGDAWRPGPPTSVRGAGQMGMTGAGAPAGPTGAETPAGPAAAAAVPAAAAPQIGLAHAMAGTSGEAKLAVRRFVHMCVEVLNGYRPAAHLRRLTLPKDAAGVVAQAVLGAGRVAEMRHGGLPGRRVRPVSRHGRGPSPVAVTRLQLCEPRPGAVEAAILLVTGERTWAMALRMERHQQTWAATTLRLI